LSDISQSFNKANNIHSVYFLGHDPHEHSALSVESSLTTARQD